MDGEPWDMFRPLTTDASLRLLHFRDDFNPQTCNAAFWRACSFALGAVLETAFKDEVAARVRLCSFPAPNLENGSFCYDVDLGENLRNWRPTDEELKCLRFVTGGLGVDPHLTVAFPLTSVVASVCYSLDIFSRSCLLSLGSLLNDNPRPVHISCQRSSGSPSLGGYSLRTLGRFCCGR